jgi:hypothetical protein
MLEKARMANERLREQIEQNELPPWVPKSRKDQTLKLIGQNDSRIKIITNLLRLEEMDKALKEYQQNEQWLRSATTTTDIIYRGIELGYLSGKVVLSASIWVSKKFATFSNTSRFLIEATHFRIGEFGKKFIEKPLAALDVINQTFKLVDAIQREDKDAAIDAGVYLVSSAATVAGASPAGLILMWYYELGYRSILLPLAGFLRDIRVEREKRYIEYIARRGAEVFDQALFLYANVAAYDALTHLGGNSPQQDLDHLHVMIRLGEWKLHYALYQLRKAFNADDYDAFIRNGSHGSNQMLMEAIAQPPGQREYSPPALRHWELFVQTLLGDVANCIAVKLWVVGAITLPDVPQLHGQIKNVWTFPVYSEGKG